MYGNVHTLPSTDLSWYRLVNSHLQPMINSINILGIALIFKNINHKINIMVVRWQNIFMIGFQQRLGSEKKPLIGRQIRKLHIFRDLLHKSCAKRTNPRYSQRGGALFQAKKSNKEKDKRDILILSRLHKYSNPQQKCQTIIYVWIGI